MSDNEDKESKEQHTPLKKISSAIPSLNMKKVALPSISSKIPAPSTQSTEHESAEDFEDVFSKESNKTNPSSINKKILKSGVIEGSLVMDPDNFDSSLAEDALTSGEFERGMAIDLNQLDDAQFLSDMKSTDETLALLKQHGQKSVYISRVYQPPAIFYTIPDREILEKYRSTYLLSIGTGRNLWMSPELVSAHSKTLFNASTRLNRKGEEIIQIHEIKTKEELEQSFQNALGHLKKYNLLILGTIYLESNSFKESPLEDCPVGKVTLKRLEQILEDRQESFEVPKLSETQFITMRYYGPNSDIIANSEAQGLMDIADEITKKDMFLKGILSGIVCVDKNSAHFFILSNNFKQLQESNPKYTIDQPTIDMMYQMIRSYELTPISWFRIRLGINSFDYMDLGRNLSGSWYELKNQGQLKMVFDEYYKYLHKILKSKADQDAIQSRMEEMEKEREEAMKKISKN